MTEDELIKHYLEGAISSFSEYVQSLTEIINLNINISVKENLFKIASRIFIFKDLITHYDLSTYLLKDEITPNSRKIYRFLTNHKITNEEAVDDLFKNFTKN